MKKQNKLSRRLKNEKKALIKRDLVNILAVNQVQ